MKRFYIIALGAILLDRATKYMVDRWLQVGQTIPIIKDALHLTHVRNAGAAFGILQGRRWLLIVTAAAVVVIILLYARQIRGNKLMEAALGLMLAGALGNLYDRLFYEVVVDFIDFRLINFAIFNIADSAITIGVALFALDVLLEHKRGRHEA
ncbi:MAG: signal peptidase II [Bacillota bacterium]|jgi:signal peptidase II